jgi:hypothetical protein
VMNAGHGVGLKYAGSHVIIIYPQVLGQTEDSSETKKVKVYYSTYY